MAAAYKHFRNHTDFRKYPATTAVIGLGSNLGDSLGLLRESWSQLTSLPNISFLALSSPYRTEPVAMDSSNWFINAVGMITTRLAPLELLRLLQQIEHRFGRRRPAQVTGGYQDRTLDLDLLLCDDRIIQSPHLILPHPRMHERFFVLAPLVEIAPHLKHPLLGKTFAELLGELGNPGRSCRKLHGW